MKYMRIKMAIVGDLTSNSINYSKDVSKFNITITAVRRENRTLLRTLRHCCFLLGMLLCLKLQICMLPLGIGRCYGPPQFVCLSFHSSRMFELKAFWFFVKTVWAVPR